MGRGNFREDLFYRINVITIHLPTLRERREDIPLLVEHFQAKYSEEYGKVALKLAPGAMDKLVRNHWQGNVTPAARKCGLERQAFQQLLRRYGIRSEDYRTQQ